MFDLKGFVQALFHKQEQGGVYNLKSATLMMQELPKSQVLQAQVEIIQALRELNSNPKISIKERFKTITYMDEKARTLQQHLIDIYQGKIVDEDAPPRQVLLAITAFWNEMANAYRKCLKYGTRTATAKEIHTFALRGVIYFCEVARWTWLRYMKVDESTWRNLHLFYRYAEQENLLQDLIQPYPDAQATSIRLEYTRILMMALSSPDKLLPNQIDLVDQWLAGWAHLVNLDREIRPHQHLFAFNIETASPPRRLRRDMTGENWRYGGTTELVSHVKPLLEAMIQGETPASLGLPEDSNDPVNLDLLHRLLDIWCREVPAPVRRHERKSKHRQITVIRGLDAVIEHLRKVQADYNGKPSKADAEEATEWTLDNESESGVGVLFQASPDEQLKVGEIVGVVSNNSPHTLTIGVIRRMTRRPDGEIDAGIETLTKTPLVVELAPLTAEQGTHVLYSPDSAVQSKDRFLLMPNEHYKEYDECTLAAQGKSYRIRLNPAKERTIKAAVANFSVIGKLRT